MKTLPVATFDGKVILKGVAHGTLFFYKEKPSPLNDQDRLVIDAQEEIDRYKRAIAVTKKELFILAKRLEEANEVESAEIFSAHLMFLDDSLFTSQVDEIIKQNKFPSDQALHQVLERMYIRLSNVKDRYFQDRIIDMKDLEQRIVNHLRGMEPKISDAFCNAIVCLEELTPSLAAEAVLKGVKGFITVKGSQASHTSVVLKGRCIPHVLVADIRVLAPYAQQLCLLNANTGIISINPVLHDVDQKSLKTQIKTFHVGSEVFTSDLKKVHLFSTFNGVEFSEELLHGIGLYRTEFLLLQDKELAFCKERQVAKYSDILQKVRQKKVVFRLFDLGGDKNFIHDPSKAAKQLRSIRYLLARKEILALQIESLIEAAKGLTIHILIPYVTSLSEVQSVQELIKHYQKTTSSKIVLGAMIESLISDKDLDLILKQVDFIAIGTNDLTQSIIEIHRDSPEFCSFQPDLFRQIKRLIIAASKQNKPVSVCGEIVSNPIFTELLVGLGACELACSLQELELIKSQIQKINFHKAEKLAEKVCDLKGSQQVKKLLLGGSA